MEEVGRIHGYEAIPEDVSVPMVPSARRRDDRVLERIRHVLSAAGFDEAVTLSVVDGETSASMSPWTDAEPLRSQMPVIRGADCLRRSLVPSLLGVRRTNEALANAEIELFEIARVYLPRGADLPQEELMLAITSGREYAFVRGVIEAILDEVEDRLAAEGRRRGNGHSGPGRRLPPAVSQRNAGVRGAIRPRVVAAVRSARTGDRGRDQALAADRGMPNWCRSASRNRPIRRLHAI